jgi:hypothetical protein
MNQRIKKLAQLNLQHKAITALRDRLAKPEQEPVAWRWKELVNNDFVSDWVLTRSDPPPYAIESMPLYASPQRPWVGLTDEDMAELRRSGLHAISDTDFRAIEAKLKEKNT